MIDLVRLVGGKDTAANRADPDPGVAAWVARHDQVAVLSQLVAARIPIAPINDVEALLRDPHVAARESIVQFDDEALGPLVLVQPSPKLSRTPGTIRSLGPTLGQHNHEIFGELLGLGDTRIKQLQDQAII